MWRLLLAVAVHAGVACAADVAPDALWQIVATCIDRTDADVPYCACPAFARSCCSDTATPDADIVWGVTDRFVAIRDMTMCGCGAGFTAGLVIPRTRVTGIEDPARPDAIWPFAWRIARERIPDAIEIALVINPDDARTQDQMHVHILRLKPDAQDRLEAMTGTVVLDLPDLQRVFSAATERVGAAAIGVHGILVTQRRKGGYRVVLTDATSPQTFTRNHCAPSTDAHAPAARRDRHHRDPAARAAARSDPAAAPQLARCMDDSRRTAPAPSPSARSPR
ncbi:MAG TPA: CDP-diacylglycerol diphosphatase [Candidatus Binatia bacterium]|jgi:hypothetical protein|nr:CDP-diacylglycerol diphosphatase [Candidatus Binatia bacterium]